MKPDEAPREEIKFRYNRAERLAKAPAETVWLAERQGRGRPSFFRDLASNRPLVILFLTLVFAVVAVNVFTLLSNDAGTARIGPYSFAVEAFRFGEELYVTVVAKTEAGPGGPISIYRDDDGTALSSGALPVSGSLEYRFTLPDPGGKAVPKLKIAAAGATVVVTLSVAGGRGAGR